MRVLHTADFHAGKTLRGYDRTPEIREALREIADIARSERADAALVAGDLFDGVNPSAEAEAAVFDFFLRLKEAGIPSVVIGGNHDSASRLQSLSGLLNWVGAGVVAQPSADIPQMVRCIETRNGPLVVGALPYLSERRLIKAAALWSSEAGEWRQSYRAGMEQFLRALGEQFTDVGAVNMLMLHATFDGAVASGSDRGVAFDMAHHYTLSTHGLPPIVSYVALGHVHKPQVMSQAPLTAYSGSIIQLDFGEGGEKKQVNLVEVEAGRPAQLHAIPLVSGKELLTLHAEPEGWQERLRRLEGFNGLAKVVVRAPAGSAVVGLKDQIIAAYPQVIAVELQAERAQIEAQEAAPRASLSLAEQFAAYYQREHGRLDEAVLSAFNEADEQVRQAQGESV